MAELHLVVPDSYVAEVNGLLRAISGNKNARDVTPSDIGREALGVYRWMLNEMARGNGVASVKRDVTVSLAAPPVVEQQVYTPRTAAPFTDKHD